MPCNKKSKEKKNEKTEKAVDVDDDESVLCLLTLKNKKEEKSLVNQECWNTYGGWDVMEYLLDLLFKIFLRNGEAVKQKELSICPWCLWCNESTVESVK